MKNIIWKNLSVISLFFVSLLVMGLKQQKEGSEMTFFEVVKSRHSIRAYQDRPIEQEKINKILEAANSAPSAGNLQAYHIYLVRKPELKRALAQAAYQQDFVGQAAAVLVFCADAPLSAKKYGARGAALYCIQDATIAATFAQLAATALGLGSCIVGAFEENWIKKILNMPRHQQPIIVLPVGYPAEQPYITPRRPLSDLVTWFD